jgi:hypothetical protein
MWRECRHSRVPIEFSVAETDRMGFPASLLMLVSSICLAVTPGEARTATQAERAACEAKIQRKIDAIDSRMRAPYSAEDGERLRERRRKLEEQRASCRTRSP